MYNTSISTFYLNYFLANVSMLSPLTAHYKSNLRVIRPIARSADKSTKNLPAVASIKSQNVIPYASNINTGSQDFFISVKA